MKRSRADFEEDWISDDSKIEDVSSDVEHHADLYSLQNSLMKNPFTSSTNTFDTKDIDYSKVKREQRFKIHTEGHQRTVAMMMEAAKSMTFETEAKSTMKIDMKMQQELQQVTYIQKPFW